jgi:uncharacterized protein (DUF1330 family)
VKYYAIAEIDITDPSWVRDYVTNVTAIVERQGGRYLARTGKIEQVEGEGERTPPQALVLIEWPSKEVAEAFYESDEYRPYRESRRAGANNEFFLVAGEDVNGVARIEP